MIRLNLLTLALAMAGTALLPSASALGQQERAFDEPEPNLRDVVVSGTVFEDADGDERRGPAERAMPGVWVSGGGSIVETDEEGRFRFALEGVGEHRNVFVTPPPGYPGHDAVASLDPHGRRGDGLRVRLRRAAGPPPADRDFRFVVTADSQFSSPQQGEWLAEDFAQNSSTTGAPRFHVIVGDLVQTGWLEEWRLYDEARKAMPHYDVYGGHGGNYGRSTWLERGSVTHFNLFCGPSYYSWHYGGRHFVVFNTAISHGTPAKRQRQRDWTRDLIARLPQGTEVVLFAHHTASLDEWRERHEVAAFFYGHHHENSLHYHLGTPYLCINAIRGLDWGMMTRAARVADFRDGELITEIRPLGQYQRLESVWPQDGGAVPRGPAPFRAVAYDSSSAVQRVTGLLRGPGLGEGHPVAYSRLGAWTWGAEVDAATLVPGDYRLQLTAEDDGGASWSGAYAFQVEDRPPAAAAPGDDWPAFFKNEEELRSTRERLAPPLELAWTVHTGGRNELGPSPIVWQGRVYCGSQNDDLGGPRPAVSCYDAATGDLVWRHETAASVRSVPAVVDGVLVALTAEGEALGFDAESGRPLWRRGIPGFGGAGHSGFKAPVAEAGGLAVVAASRGPVILLDPATGEVAGTCAERTGDRYLAAPLVKDGRVYVAARNQTWCADLETGETLWSTETRRQGSRGVGTPFLRGGELIHATAFRGALGFDAETGEARVLASVRSGGWAVATPAVADGWLFTGGSAVVAADIETGEVKWQRSFALSEEEERTNRRQNVGGCSSPVVSGDWIFVGTDTGEVVALGRADGVVAWRFRTGVPVKSSPVVSGNMLFVKDWDGNLHAFAARAESGAAQAP